jgi:hypothetical protein
MSAAPRSLRLSHTQSVISARDLSGFRDVPRMTELAQIMNEQRWDAGWGDVGDG